MTSPGGFPVTANWGARRAHTDYGGDDYAHLIETLRAFLDQVAGARPDIETIQNLDRSLHDWSDVLAPLTVPEREQVFAHRVDLPGRGQTMSPVFQPLLGDENQVSGTARFGRYYLGGNGAVHGGAIPLLFDEVLGRLANIGGRKPARTAYLNVDYRSITPIDVDLQVSARFVEEEGRKRFLVGQLHNGAVLCAEVHALFVQLNPGQP